MKKLTITFVSGKQTTISCNNRLSAIALLSAQHFIMSHETILGARLNDLDLKDELRLLDVFCSYKEIRAKLELSHNDMHEIISEFARHDNNNRLADAYKKLLYLKLEIDQIN
jgi:hypothetical protein